MAAEGEHPEAPCSVCAACLLPTAGRRHPELCHRLNKRPRSALACVSVVLDIRGCPKHSPQGACLEEAAPRGPVGSPLTHEPLQAPRGHRRGALSLQGPCEGPGRPGREEPARGTWQGGEAVRPGWKPGAQCVAHPPPTPQMSRGAKAADGNAPEEEPRGLAGSHLSLLAEPRGPARVARGAGAAGAQPPWSWPCWGCPFARTPLSLRHHAGPLLPAWCLDPQGGPAGRTAATARRWPRPPRG